MRTVATNTREDGREFLAEAARIPDPKRTCSPTRWLRRITHGLPQARRHPRRGSAARRVGDVIRTIPGPAPSPPTPLENHVDDAVDDAQCDDDEELRPAVLLYDEIDAATRLSEISTSRRTAEAARRRSPRRSPDDDGRRGENQNEVAKPSLHGHSSSLGCPIREGSIIRPTARGRSGHVASDA